MPPRKVRRVAPPEHAAQSLPVDEAPVIDRSPTEPPADWRKGQLLNVRNRGDAYVITLYPDEFDERYPERAMRFTNPGECQDFVSRWYAAESHDPRAR
jgi:hypothetical protein